MKPKDLPLFRNKDAKKALEETCSKHGVSIDLLQQLLEVQRKYAGSGRALGISAEYESCIADFLDLTNERVGVA